jgi:hypothetical protein
MESAMVRGYVSPRHRVRPVVKRLRGSGVALTLLLAADDAGQSNRGCLQGNRPLDAGAAVRSSATRQLVDALRQRRARPAREPADCREPDTRGGARQLCAGAGAPRPSARGALSHAGSQCQCPARSRIGQRTAPRPDDPGLLRRQHGRRQRQLRARPVGADSQRGCCGQGQRRRIGRGSRECAPVADRAARRGLRGAAQPRPRKRNSR